MEPRLSYLIGRLDRVLRRRLAAAVEPAGLTLPAYVALSVLRAQDGLSNAQLARPRNWSTGATSGAAPTRTMAASSAPS